MISEVIPDDVEFYEDTVVNDKRTLDFVNMVFLVVGFGTVLGLGLTLIIAQHEEGFQVIKYAIAVGIFNDLGPGSNIETCIITASHTEMLCNVEMPGVRTCLNMKFCRVSINIYASTLSLCISLELRCMFILTQITTRALSANEGMDQEKPDSSVFVQIWKVL
jgi:hypothetical protein